ncbi:hypothetical protein D3C84_408620 [compost metagenome]
MLNNYFFPLLFLQPKFVEEFAVGNYRLAPRKWSTSIFDLATLSTKHKLHLPYQLMDVLLGSCNCELAVAGANTPEEAVQMFEDFRIGLYASGVSPFICPFFTTESINAYSGINERDSAIGRGIEPKIASSFSSATAQLEAWPHELSLQCSVTQEALTLSPQQIEDAVFFASKWGSIATRSPSIGAFSGAFKSSPLLGSTEQSILHAWTGIESLFPTVSTEVSFRIALYLSVLCAETSQRSNFHRKVKLAYGTRSKIAHGTSKSISREEWLEAWQIMVKCAKSIANRGELPSEEKLLIELLDGKIINA